MGRRRLPLRQGVLELARAALAAIEAARSRIDDLNVYPVPDGDTGTNLALTVRAVVEELESTGTDDRAALAHEISRAALMGARGNSGVILSQIVRGAAESLAESDDLAGALRWASDAAYRAVRKPVEGTMLTAIRKLAEEAEAGSDLVGGRRAGDDCVRRTREMLPVLTEAGVVDAGAAGLVEILRGIAGALAGEPLPAAPVVDRPAPAVESVHQHLVGVPLLHRLRRRGRPARRRRARALARADRRLAARRRRCIRAQGSRPYRRPRPRSLARRRPRDDRERRDRGHARADARAGASPPAGRCRNRRSPRACWSRSSQASGTGGCSRISARTSSTEGAR